jgi:hypothetical protein
MRGIKRAILIFTCLLACSAYFGTGVLNARFAQPAPRGGKFPHAKAGERGLKGHRDLTCSECHLIATRPPYTVSGKPSPEAKDVPVSPFPGHASCVQCHNFALMLFTKPGYCGICHQQNALSTAQPMLFDQFQTSRARSDFGSDFSHVAHRKPLPDGLTLVPAAQRSSTLARAQLASGAAPRCTDCHAPIQAATASAQELTTETGHVTCFTCHLQKPSQVQGFPVPGDCRGCHVLTEPSAAKQQSPKLFATAKVLDFHHYPDHELDTRSVKKSEAAVKKAPDYLCSECHSAVVRAENLNDIKAPGFASCSSCHNERRKPGLPDPLSAAVLRTLRRDN